jgi:hypothetical protein
MASGGLIFTNAIRVGSMSRLSVKNRLRESRNLADGRLTERRGGIASTVKTQRTSQKNKALISQGFFDCPAHL